MSAPACVVWWARLGSLTDRHLALLDQTEHGRRQAYRRPADQERFALGAAVLKLAVGSLTAVAPDRVRIDRTCPDCARPHGRPRVVVVSGEVHASVSHSGALVAVAVSADAPLGVDVEEVSDRDLGTLARAVLGHGEAVSGPHEFFVTWTRKESAVKATGDGLRVPLREVVVSRPADPPRLLSYPGRPDLAAGMMDLHPPDPIDPAVAPLHRAALTVLSTTPPTMDERDASDLLG